MSEKKDNQGNSSPAKKHVSIMEAPSGEDKYSSNSNKISEPKFPGSALFSSR